MYLSATMPHLDSDIQLDTDRFGRYSKPVWFPFSEISVTYEFFVTFNLTY